MSYMKNTIVKDIDGNAFTFRNYPSERLYIDSIYSRLSLIENEVRRLIMDYIIYNAIPFNSKETSSIILEKLNISKEKFKQILDSLVSKNAMVMDEDNNVNFIYPVSAFNTNHKVHLSDGRVFSAMCAVDAMGSSFTFNQNIKINSKCSECGEDIFVEIKNGQLANYSPELTHVLHVDLNKNQNWSGNCWNIMNFFCTKKHYDTWVNKMQIPEEDIFCLDIQEAILVAKMIFNSNFSKDFPYANV